MSKRWCVLGAVVVHTLAGAAMGQATFKGLGFVSGASESRATAVSANGKAVAGYCVTGSVPVPWRWKEADGMLALGTISGGANTGEARGITDDGAAVVGSNLGGITEGWYWSVSSGFDGLGYLPGGFSERSQAYGISGDGTVIVGYSVSDDGVEACVWFYPGAPVGLGDLPDGSFASTAYATNLDGTVIIGQGRSASGREAFRDPTPGAMAGIGDLSGGAFESIALGTSSDGKVIVGWGLSDLGREAYIYRDGSGKSAIGDFPGGISESAANGVSGDGQWVVGYGHSAAGKEALIWHKDLLFGFPQILRDYLISLGAKNLTGWTLTEAMAISRDGRTIVGYGTDPSGKVQAWKAYIDRDADGDGLFDLWETEGEGIDSDGDGTVDLDLYALGARPDHKDIFVEVDAMTGVGPQSHTVSAADKAIITDNGLSLTNTSLDMVAAAFARSPHTNPDGDTGVRLHVKVDETGLSAEDWSGDEWGKFDAVKGAHFGDQSSAKKRAAQKLVYRYNVWAKKIFGDSTSGVSELPGNDFVVCLGQWPRPGGGFGGGVFAQAGTFMHEMGHSLGLGHGGTDHENYKPNYKSIMNYMWQFPRPGIEAGWKIDYSRSALPSVDESHLDETKGFGHATGIRVLIGPSDNVKVVPGSGPIDLNGDRDSTDSDVSRDVSYVYDGFGPSLDSLAGAEDWLRIKIAMETGGDYADGSHATAALVVDIDSVQSDFLDSIPSPCPPDCNGDSKLNVNDFICFQVQWREKSPYGDFDDNYIWNVNDFIKFQASYRAGCP